MGPRGSVVDRVSPEASCWEWHGDGTAGEHERASHLMVEAQARRWVRPIRLDTSLVGKRASARPIAQAEGFSVLRSQAYQAVHHLTVHIRKLLR